MSHSALELALGIAESLAGFVLLWATLRITSAAGFHTAQGRWALCRRAVYGSQAVALFGLGLSHVDGYTMPDALRITFQFVIMAGVIAFPLLRAFGCITQDQFRTVDGTYERRTGRGRF